MKNEREFIGKYTGHVFTTTGHEIVRCKDCKHAGHLENQGFTLVCRLRKECTFYTNKNGYCHLGVRT